MTGTIPRPAAIPLETDVRLAARAILIVLVVIGHNQLFRGHFYYSGYIWLYSFHVGSFFLLATLSPPRQMNSAVMSGMLSRFYKPFLVFTLVYGILYLPIYLTPYDHSMKTWASDMVLATCIATAQLLDVATGLKLLWFLPAFMSFCVFYNLYGQLRGRLRAVSWSAAALVHCTIAMLPAKQLVFVPLGLAVALFLALPALVFTRIRWVLTTAHGPRLVVLLFMATSAMIVALRTEIILSDMRMPSIRTPGLLALCDLQLVLGGVTCLIAARALAGLRTIRWIGKRSLHIYLLHAPFNIAIASVLGPVLPWPMAMGCTIVATIAATALATRLIEATPANLMVFSTRRHPLTA